MAKITLDSLLNIEPVKVSTDAKSASLMILGAVKSGKSTLIHEIYGERLLFIATEYRHDFLNGAKVININNWGDFLKVMKFIKDPQVQEQYDAICIDTFTRLEEWCEKYTLANLQIDDLGDLGFGKGHKAYQTEMNRGIEMIEKSGYVPHFIVHTKAVTKKEPIENLDPNEIEGNVTKTLDKKTGIEYYEYVKQEPDLRVKTFNAINRVCDNIIYLDIVHVNGKEERRIYYRESHERVAGSSLKYMPEYTKLSAKDYLDAFKQASEKEGNTTTEAKHRPKEEDSQFDFDALMKEVGELGKKLQSEGRTTELTQTIEEVLGKGRKVKDLDSTQAEVLSVLVDKLKSLD